ncbi:MAG: hypothetical protein NTZ28_02895 [Nitrospirae bacterium]|nr:hypothetical protein [Nitrospirota bacterium]
MNVFIREMPIVEEFKRRVEERFPGELVRLVLFGSKVRGEATVRRFAHVGLSFFEP